MITEEELKEMCKIEGYYILSSKQITNKYYDMKSMYCNDHDLVLNYFIDKITDYDFDTIVSIEMGGAIIASGLCERLNKSLAICRKDRPNVGVPKGKCLIVDDVSSTGMSINIIRKWIQDCNAEIVQTIIGIDRRKYNDKYKN